MKKSINFQSLGTIIDANENIIYQPEPAEYLDLSYFEVFEHSCYQLGKGIKAKKEIKQGTQVGFYAGKILANTHRDRYSVYFPLNKDTQQRISANEHGNITRYFQHAIPQASLINSTYVDANLELIWVVKNNILVPTFSAARDIKENEQLCWDYGKTAQGLQLGFITKEGKLAGAINEMHHLLAVRAFCMSKLIAQPESHSKQIGLLFFLTLTHGSVLSLLNSEEIKYLHNNSEILYEQARQYDLSINDTLAISHLKSKITPNDTLRNQLFCNIEKKLNTRLMPHTTIMQMPSLERVAYLINYISSFPIPEVLAYVGNSYSIKQFLSQNLSARQLLIDCLREAGYQSEAAYQQKTLNDKRYSIRCAAITTYPLRKICGFFTAAVACAATAVAVHTAIMKFTY